MRVAIEEPQKKVVMSKGDKEQEQKEERKGSAMEKVNKGFKRFLEDLTNKRLFVYKMIYFTLLAGVVILWPQFTVHQASLGLTVAHTGTFSAIVSGVSVVIPFLSGVLGDKMGNYKIMLIITTLLAALLALLFSIVPSAKIPNLNNLNGTNYTTDITTTSTYDTVTLPTPANSTSSSSSLGLVDEDLMPFTFWSYLAVRVLYGVLQAVSYTLFEAAVMVEVQATGMDYGFQRAWGTLGVMVASFLSGYLVELTAGFSIVFYISTALQVVAAALMLFLRLEFKLPATSLTRNILSQIANAEVLMFFAAVLVAGIFFGFLETYMYRYLSGLGASPVLVGLTVTVGAPFEVVLTLLASYLVPLTGHAPIIVFGLFGHAVRLFGFSLLVNPWWVLPFEILESVTNGLLVTVGIMYCTVLFSLESIASFRGIFSVVYFGVGQLVGAASGSWLQSALGDRGAFRAFGYFAVAFAFSYAAAYYAFRRRGRSKEEARGPAEHAGENRSSQQPASSNVGTQMKGFDNKAWVADV
ncbi:major facilitator superfamily domain-containing protein 6-like isoform X1 [Eriocheir sinensis]|uniref:major facilitator superfamily domain-containing protein 6-like isoform X1 n=3 Tax=Eriocheir sinensis TaxID=95602 RepID=UPI0021C718C4|nr:major facilitator superfamily domain-containing protein 6-like isoform X1 [Eriocheir sinensis]XP_050738507.1 major facilitator superfamily domain-containing protein 6-like isoform X1 [Eriocheir sinensis]XP_050738508.1 major facilitator superfamily domain-containing protein 6-like isoform X1 [Eriocheir sinensis]